MKKILLLITILTSSLSQGQDVYSEYQKHESSCWESGYSRHCEDQPMTSVLSREDLIVFDRPVHIPAEGRKLWYFFNNNNGTAEVVCWIYPNTVVKELFSFGTFVKKMKVDFARSNYSRNSSWPSKVYFKNKTLSHMKCRYADTSGNLRVPTMQEFLDLLFDGNISARYQKR